MSAYPLPETQKRFLPPNRGQNKRENRDYGSPPIPGCDKEHPEEARSCTIKESYTWEMSKENVLPLTRGRKVEHIERAFGGAICADSREEGSRSILEALKRCVSFTININI